MSVVVIIPTSSSLSITGNLRIFFSDISLLASTIWKEGLIVITGCDIISCSLISLGSPFLASIFLTKSRSVTIPTTFPPCVTKRHPKPPSAIFFAAVVAVSLDSSEATSLLIISETLVNDLQSVAHLISITEQRSSEVLYQIAKFDDIYIAASSYRYIKLYTKFSLKNLYHLIYE